MTQDSNSLLVDFRVDGRGDDLHLGEGVGDRVDSGHGHDQRHLGLKTVKSLSNPLGLRLMLS